MKKFFQYYFHHCLQPLSDLLSPLSWLPSKFNVVLEFGLSSTAIRKKDLRLADFAHRGMPIDLTRSYLARNWATQPFLNRNVIIGDEDDVGRVGLLSTAKLSYPGEPKSLTLSTSYIPT